MNSVYWECIEMKKITLSLVLVLSLALPVNAYNMKHFTEDIKVTAALELLDKVGADEIFDNLQANSVKIIFYDLSLMSYDYRYHYAINGTNNFGDRYILINTRYRKCSTEEIACLIAHESCHKAKVATFAEETLATQTEARYWLKLKNPNKIYTDNDLKNRLDNLAYLYSHSDKNNNRIEERIANSEFYRNQFSIK